LWGVIGSFFKIVRDGDGTEYITVPHPADAREKWFVRYVAYVAKGRKPKRRRALKSQAGAGAGASAEAASAAR